MKKIPALVIIKPNGIAKAIFGHILTKFAQADLEIVGMRVMRMTRHLAEEHYKHIKDQPFFTGVIEYLMGKYHKRDKVIAMVYYGTDAIKKCRQIAGATNPEEADPQSIRGSFGRITTDGVYENVVHVSSDAAEAEREIKLWFPPDSIVVNLYPTNTIKDVKGSRQVWA